MPEKAAPQKSPRELPAVSLKNAQRSIGPHADEAHFRNHIVPITKRGKEYAALIGPTDLARLRQLDGKKKTA
jgi:hypothetical protein